MERAMSWVLTEVTPERATEMLGHLPETQRKLSNARVEDFERLMQTGEFRTTHQGIAYDTSGHLIDGQHRLRAIERTGLTQLLWVAYNVDPSAFSIIDTHQRRTAAQFIHDKHATMMTGAASIILNLQEGTAPVPYGQARKSGGHIPYPFERILTEVDTDVYARYAAACYDAYRGARVTPTRLLAVIVQAHHSPHADDIGTFLHGLTTGAELDAQSPVLALRSRFLREYAYLNRSNFVDAYWLIVRAWNAHARGDKLTKLQMPNNPIAVIGTTKVKQERGHR